MKYRVPQGCESIKFDDGRKYKVRGDVRGGGVVTIDNPVHQAEFAKRNRESGGMVHTFIPVAGAGQRERRCEPCAFNAFPFQKTCPRCGQPTKEV